MTGITMGKALNLALHDALERDDHVVMFGEDVGKLGGVFRVSDGLQDEFGRERVFNTPLAEATIAALALGLAMKGFRPVAEMQFDAFSYPSFQQVTSNIAAIEQHSESPETYYAHTAGLKVVTPSTPEDAYRLLTGAIQDPDPVIFLEPKARYWMRQDVDLPASPLPLDRAHVVREGRDVTVIAYGPTVQTALAAAEQGEGEGVSLEVVDLRSLAPLDMETLRTSVRKTRRAVVVHEAPVFMGLGAEIVAQLMHDLFDVLEAPIERVGNATIPYPPSRFEKLFLPDADRILEAVDRTREY